MPESEPDWDTVTEMEAESRRDRASLIADEDVTFPEDEQDPLPPGRRRPLSFGEEQADIINATGA